MSSSEGVVLSDEELTVLTNLAYLDNNQFWSGEFENQDMTLGEILNEAVTAEEMNELRYGDSATQQDSHFTNGVEWYNIINEVKTNPNLSNLKLADIDSYNTNGSKAFTVTSGDQTYIVFQGTGGSAEGSEWPDNVEGLNRSDTNAQMAALNYAKYINSRYGGDITVAGHSKGANKSMYTAITAPFITRCVAVDGQGFSSDFLLRYGDLIKERSGLITAYNVDKDFVNPLLFKIAGTNYFVEGHGIDGITGYPRYHSASAVMDFQNGNLEFVMSNQAASSVLINDFTVFLLDSVPDKHLDVVTDFLSNLIDALFDGSGNKDVFAVIAENPEGFGTLLACIASYPNSALLFQSIIYDVTGLTVPFLTILSILQLDSPDILKNLSSFSAACTLLLMKIAEIFGFDSTWGTEAGAAFLAANEAIGPGNGSLRDALGVTGGKAIVRDFTEAKKAEFKAIIEEIDSEAWFDPTKWDIWYRAESWFGRLTIENYQDNMNEYFRKTLDVNDTSTAEIEQIFTKAKEEDDKYASEVKAIADDISSAGSQFDTILNSVSTT